jgi:hypothetical protein
MMHSFPQNCRCECDRPSLVSTDRESPGGFVLVILTVLVYVGDSSNPLQFSQVFHLPLEGANHLTAIFSIFSRWRLTRTCSRSVARPMAVSWFSMPLTRAQRARPRWECTLARGPPRHQYQASRGFNVAGCPFCRVYGVLCRDGDALVIRAIIAVAVQCHSNVRSSYLPVMASDAGRSGVSKDEVVRNVM